MSETSRVRDSKREKLILIDMMYAGDLVVFSQYSSIFLHEAWRARVNGWNFGRPARLNHARWRASSAGIAQWRVETLSDEKACCALSACWRLLCFDIYYKYNDRRTLSKPRKVFTRNHSSLVSFSSRTLSRFAESFSSQRSSSTKESMHCRKEVMNMDVHLKLITHILFSFCTIKHQICWWPPHLHIEYKLKWRSVICHNLNGSPHFFSLWWGAFLLWVSNINIFRLSIDTCLDYDCPYQPHLISGRWHMCIWLPWVEMNWFAVCWDKHLRR